MLVELHASPVAACEPLHDAPLLSGANLQWVCTVPTIATTTTHQQLSLTHPKHRDMWYGLMITGSMVVLTCCNGDWQSQSKTSIFGASQLENPSTDFDKIWQRWLHRRRDPLMPNLVIVRSVGACPGIGKVVKPPLPVSIFTFLFYFFEVLAHHHHTLLWRHSTDAQQRLTTVVYTIQFTHIKKTSKFSVGDRNYHVNLCSGCKPAVSSMQQVLQ